MSEENVESVRAALASWNRGDLHAMLAQMHPDVEIELTGMFSGLDRKLHGHEGFRRVWEELQGTWKRLRIDVEEAIPRGDLVFIGTRFHGRGRSGIEVERPFFFLFGYRDGKVAWYRSFAERTAALEAAGLSEY